MFHYAFVFYVIPFMVERTNKKHTQIYLYLPVITLIVHP